MVNGCVCTDRLNDVVTTPPFHPENKKYYGCIFGSGMKSVSYEQLTVCFGRGLCGNISFEGEKLRTVHDHIIENV